MSHCPFVLALLLSSFFAFSQNAVPKVLIIGIDGAKPEAIRAAETPNLDLLMQNGLSSFDALTDYPTYTFPGFASMLTGTWNEKHKVLSNTITPSNQLVTYPIFLERVEEFDSTLNTVAIVRTPFENLFFYSQDNIDTVYYLGFDENIRNFSVGVMTLQDPDVMFTYFVRPDFGGHAYGFEADVPQYIAQIEAVDFYIGNILDAMITRPNFQNEDWLVLVSTDHGGYDVIHGGASIAERNVFFIAAGDSIPVQQVNRDTTDAQIDTALLFNGTNQFAAIPYDPAYDFGSTTDFTIECWVKPDPTNLLNVILSNQALANIKSKGFSIGYNYSNNKQWVANLGDGTKNFSAFGGKLSTNAMQHIAISVDRDGLMTLYQDGVNIDAHPIGQIGNLDAIRNIGIAQDGVFTFPNSFDGAIRELRIWNAALTDEVIADYAGKSLDANHPFSANLIGYWTMDELSGNGFSDQSSNQNDAMLSDPSMEVSSVNFNLQCYNYNHTPRVVDVTYNALRHMCIPIDPSWGLDGKSWIDKDCQFEQCRDGIQNGNETGIDCGGDCPSCPTCTDGIQNGNETGIDCGGDCAPCPDLCSYQLINYSDFESGNFGFWQDGGADCLLNSSSAPYSIGIFSVRLQDNTPTSVMTTASLDLSDYEELYVAFSYFPLDMDNATEDFWLQVSLDGGASFTIVESWSYNVEFVNGIRYYETVTIPGPFTTTTQLRFRCDASSNQDFVYIDSVVVGGCYNTNKMGPPSLSAQADLNYDQPLDDLRLYPNPVRDVLAIEFQAGTNEAIAYTISDRDGKELQQSAFNVHREGTTTFTVNTSSFTAGMYMLQLTIGNEKVVRKFLVK